MAWDTQGQQPHPTVGMNGAGAPPMQMPQQQGWQQPTQQFAPQQPQGWQPAPIGMPQYNGQVPINGMTQQQMPQQQAQQPHPTIPFGQQPQQPQPQPQFQQQPAQQPMFQQPPRIQSTGAEILDGPGVPMELRGRTMAQAMQIYNTLAEREIQRQRAGGQQPGQQQMPSQQPFQPQVGQPQQQPAQQPRFWQAPEQVVGQQVQQAVQQQLAPVNEFIQRQAVAGALQQAAQSIPDFQQLQQHIMPIVQGADPKNLADPAFWEGAADLARGRAYRAQQQGPQQQQMYQPMAQQQRWTPAYQLPQPAGSFFTEGPTPPMGMNGMHQQHQFSPIEQSAMSAMGMSPDMWLAYKQGVQRPQRGW